MIDPQRIVRSLMEDRSKQNIDRLVDAMAQENLDLALYLNAVESTALPVKWYMTWTLNHYFDRFPHLSAEKQALLWDFLKKTEHEGMLRDLWRIMSVLKIDDQIGGEVFEKALQITAGPSHPTAVRAHAMQTVLHIGLAYPELLDEYEAVLHSLQEMESSSIKARVRNHLKAIQKAKKEFG